MPIQDPTRKDQYGRSLVSGVRLEIDERQARIIRKIFTLYASGLSIKSVAKRMNREKTESPTPRAGREQSWAPSSIRVILRNERYRGIVVWSKTKKVRNPQTGRRVQRKRPKNEWVHVEQPELRIVPESMWKGVQDRLAFVNEQWGAQSSKGGRMNGRLAASPYIFSGLLRCGECGGNYQIVSGVGRKKNHVQYGCARHAQRGACPNKRRLNREDLERELLAKLQADILSDAAIDYLCERVEGEIQKRSAALDSDMDERLKRKHALEREVKNLTRTIAEGMDSPAVRNAITERERELTAITE